jgi:hypothetical protein
VLRLVTILVVFMLAYLAAVAQGVEVRVMQRVDTTHPQVRDVLRHWVDSLSAWSVPDSPASPHIERPTTQSVVRDWFYHQQARPTILSIEYNGHEYLVRTLFSVPQGTTRNELPLGILSCHLVAGPEHMTWTIDDPLDAATRHWDTTRIDNVSLIHSPVCIIDSADVARSIEIAQRASDRFALNMPPHTTCYIVESRDELCQLLGVEYYAYPPSGLAFPRSALVVTSYDASLAHELIHVLFAPYATAHPVFREGIATLLGGTGVMDVDHAIDQYVRERKEDQAPTFVQLFLHSDVAQHDLYVIGAVVCRAILRAGGRAALFDVMEMERTSDVMYRVATLLDIDIADQQRSMYSYVAQQSNGVTLQK